MTERCLRIDAIGGGRLEQKIVLVAKRAGNLDLNPALCKWLTDTIDDRRNFQEKPIIVEGKKETSYELSLQRFAEAFFGRNSPKEVADFFAKWLEKGEFEEEFLNQVRGFEKRFKATIPVIACSEGARNYNTRSQIYFLPINFDKKEINALIDSLPKGERPKKEFRDPLWTRRKGLSPKRQNLSKPIYFDFYDKRGDETAFMRVREKLLEQKPAITTYGQGWHDGLDIEQIIKNYGPEKIIPGLMKQIL